MKKGRDKLQTIFVDIRYYFEISNFETTRAKCTTRIQKKRSCNNPQEYQYRYLLFLR